MSITRSATKAVTAAAINVLTRPAPVPHPWAPPLHDRVRGKIALITGASSGIGRQLAIRLADEGARVIVTARRADELDLLVKQIQDGGGRAFAIPADLGSAEGVDDLADRVLADHGVPDVLVLNAGRSIRRSIARAEHRLHDYDRAMQINYLGAVGLTLRLLPGMRERGSGHVVSSSSVGVQADLPRFSAYIGSKAALDAFLRVAAVECLADGVKFTTVHLPLVDTDMIGPTGWDGFKALTVEEAAEMMADAIRRQPDHLGVLSGNMTAVAKLAFPETLRWMLHQFHKMVPDSAAARPSEARPEGDASSVDLAKVARAQVAAGRVVRITSAHSDGSSVNGTWPQRGSST